MPQKGHDIEYNLSITLEESVFGAEKKLALQKEDHIEEINITVQTPVLLLPVNGTLVGFPCGSFKFTEIPEATGYRIQVSDTPDFSNLIIDEIVAP